MAQPPGPAPATIRLDKLLWYLRFAKSRALAQQWVLGGHIRLNGARVLKPAQGIGAGDVLTLPLPSGVRVLRLLTIPQRRGPSAEAAACYALLENGQP
jgi:ribosome-associated heat shock protein Hsp15